MADPWCDHCDLPSTQCVHGNAGAREAERDVMEATGARHSGPLPRRSLVADGPTIDATQTSPCAGCGGMIEPEDRITHTEEGWAHADEVEPAETVKPRTQTDLFEGF